MKEVLILNGLNSYVAGKDKKTQLAYGKVIVI